MPCSHPKDLPQLPDFPGHDLRDIQLELSLKPFFDASDATRDAVCRELFQQWQPLWRNAESVSIQLWIAEGSDILEYDGNSDTAFEWARYHGAPNRHRWHVPKAIKANNPDHVGIGVNMSEYDPDGVGIHARGYLYRDEPAMFTYGWLRDLVAAFKRIGGEITGRAVYVGATFDIGPEFAKSRFKYDWHREILSDGPMFKEQFVSCEAVLKGDDRKYAAFPDGIPDGTRIGTFLGRQANAFFEDCGFDFLWLSNGFGFSLEPWAMVGEVFDGERFHTDKVAQIRDRILAFWKDLRAEFPVKYPIRTRGTNLGTGIDLGSDASPLRDIYASGFNVDAPVNSPWAALDGDFGLELSGWMSHVARNPGETFRYRFYTHDPWWLNSPWLDRYAREPHDIYLPLSVSRLTADGSVQIPRDIAFLSADDSHGQLPPSVPTEVAGHILRARELAPDGVAPLLWVYPFDDFHELTLSAGRPDLPLHADAYIGTVINAGVPLNAVVDLADLDSAWPKLSEADRNTVLVTPVPPAGSQSERLLQRLVSDGASLMLYGPLPEGSAFLKPLGINHAAPIEGDFTFGANAADQRCLRHTALLSGGAFTEAATTDSGTSPGEMVLVEQGAEARVLTASGTLGLGKVVWTRASLTTAEYNPDDPQPIRGPILKPHDAATFVPPGEPFRAALANYGLRFAAAVSAYEGRPPYLTAHRCRNAFVLSGHHRDEHAVQRVRFPLGAPLLPDRYNSISDGMTEISGRRAWFAECRVFIDGVDAGMVRLFEPPPLAHGIRRRLLVLGCRGGGTIHFLPETGYTDSVRIVRDPHFPYFAGDISHPKVTTSAHGPLVCIENVDTDILIEW